MIVIGGTAGASAQPADPVSALLGRTQRATGEHRLFQNLPGNWPSYGDIQHNTSVTGSGPVEYRLVTNGGGYSEQLVLATP